MFELGDEPSGMGSVVAAAVPVSAQARPPICTTTSALRPTDAGLARLNHPAGCTRGARGDPPAESQGHDRERIRRLTWSDQVSR
jgi:hypothetical protein